MPYKDYQKKLECNRKVYKRNRLKYLQQKKEYNLLYPWKTTLHDIRKRCENKNCPEYKRYGGRGIKCLITEIELKELWFRDNASKMERPSIDRINPDGDYIFENCRYLELSENSKRARHEHLYHPVLQFDLQGNFIKEFKSMKDAALETNQFSTNISACVRGLMKTANGFIWKYKITI